MVLRTDMNIVQLPAVLPDFSHGKNTVCKDPDFGTNILRFTDATDIISGSSIQTADTGYAGIWNTNDTMLMVRGTGGVSFVYQFDPKKFQRLPSLIGRYTGKLCFSKKVPNTLYNLVGTTLTKITFQLKNGVWSEKSRSNVCDFIKVLPVGFKVNWVGSFVVSQGDVSFAAAFSEGVQNTSFLACTYQPGLRKGFRVLNTNTGIVSGDWGEKGAVRLNSPDISFPFTMHEFSQNPNPIYASVGAKDEDSAGNCIWNIPTLDIVDSNVSGHRAKGYLNVYAGGPGGGQIAVVNLNTNIKTMLVPKDKLPANQVPPQKLDGDAHFGFGKISPTDNSIFWVSNQSDISPFTSCWFNEIHGYDAQTGIVYRACHTFNSGKQPEFICKNAIAVPSQTGKFVAWCSDIMGTLMTPTGPRSDVFVVQVA